MSDHSTDIPEKPGKPGKPGRLARPTVDKPARSRKSAPKADQGQVTLLAGGNPQIPKGDGNAPVAAYIDAMPGWKSDVGRRLDALIVRAVPGVKKAVKWNSPLYGMNGEDWFLGIHCMTNYIKVGFFRGMSLQPLPPGKSRQKDVRYLDIREDGFDEEQFADWIIQASRLPGEKM